MRSFKSKVLALFLLVAMCGQVAAYPLLMCPDMVFGSDMTDTAEHSSSMEHHGDHANHSADKSSQNGETGSHICELCVSCSSASVFDYGSVANEPASDLTIATYTNPLQNSSQENPFRPPIAA